MSWSKSDLFTRKVVLPVAVLCLAAVGLIIGAQFNSTDASPADDGDSNLGTIGSTFPGANVGAIPDGTSPCWNPGTPAGGPRDVTFNVTGITGAPSTVNVNVTFGSPNHTFMGDVTAILLAPNGASHTLFGHTLATTATAFGDASDLGALYAFSDNAPAPPNGGWWQASTAAGTTTVMPTGTYRTTNSGGAGATNPMPPTNMNAAFAGVANANGTWTLRLTDNCAADTGGVTAANLTITAGGGTVSDAPVDFNADGRSDYVVVRNTGGGPAGQITWFYNFSSGGATQVFQWGLASDFYLAEDFDNDNKDDIAVWRSGPPTVAAFYIHNSATNTARVEAFGQTGDDPTVVDDYNNDGSADLAVYRAGSVIGAQSTWYYRTTPGGPVTFVPWGINGDLPAPGDYDGDGSADFVVQRAAGGSGIFYRRFATGTTDAFAFGNAADLIAPGDYDDDGKTDVCVVRDTGGNYTWYWEPSGTAGITSVQATFGNSATDFPTQGDYDGDGRTDPAIWRDGAFWVLNLQTSGVSVFSLGSPGDYPVANFNVH
jgi:hypothetical protein